MADSKLAITDFQHQCSIRQDSFVTDQSLLGTHDYNTRPLEKVLQLLLCR